ncbi:hypothetical protein DB30_04971 [Enhygromyxa salina]|uniref:Uncharacterized protein n=1 Tax=Enhygromyxa salina TaxID=215803 RepID=A0A0C1ZEK0_9BACT|nr:hypothetical protein [Enhygromyxa salina]KIG16099.1 hypothetical protein DB30_04971 [Enhygromyxa salina]
MNGNQNNSRGLANVDRAALENRARLVAGDRIFFLALYEPVTCDFFEGRADAEDQSSVTLSSRAWTVALPGRISRDSR